MTGGGCTESPGKAGGLGYHRGSVRGEVHLGFQNRFKGLRHIRRPPSNQSEASSWQDALQKDTPPVSQELPAQLRVLFATSRSVYEHVDVLFARGRGPQKLRTLIFLKWDGPQEHDTLIFFNWDEGPKHETA